MKCNTCGASIENTANRSSYKCEYCGSYNYDENYIEKRFESLNLTKANEVLNIAQLRYKSGRYDEAIELITESLKEKNGMSNILIECDRSAKDFKFDNLDFTINEKIISINTKKPTKNLPIILKILAELNLSIVNIELKKSNLEQVFLKLTKK